MREVTIKIRRRRERIKIMRRVMYQVVIKGKQGMQLLAVLWLVLRLL